MKLEKFSFGIGDRFAHQGKAQLQAMIKAAELGINIVPVWNKSFREHKTIGTQPQSTRLEANEATSDLGWDKPFYCDADHINLSNVDLFLDHCDFFTLDVADYIGQKASDSDIEAFVEKHSSLIGSLEIPGIDNPIEITKEDIKTIAEKTLLAVQEAGKIYRYIAEKKGEGKFITEVSMDETDLPQTPKEMLFILAAISDEQIPAQTIAPKFTGRFNKGVDYVGDLEVFAKEFEQDVAVIAYAIDTFCLPDTLKLSVHSGSDKFGIYSPINKTLKKFNAGIHVKTAGTTWLEEVAGLALAGGEGLEIAKQIYAEAIDRFDELCGPYATVIDIDKDKLPSVKEVNDWDEQTFAAKLRHDPDNPLYDLNVRQLIHVGYKVAAEMGDKFTFALKRYEEIIAHGVTENIFDKHILKIFKDL